MSYFPRRLVAYGRVNGATGVSAGRGATVARIGAGVYTVTLPADFQCDPAEKLITCTVVAGDNKTINVFDDNDLTTTFAIGLDGGGGNADSDFYFSIERVDTI